MGRRARETGNLRAAARRLMTSHTMNGRHTAALVLGWYLFTPPPGAEAPIAEWNHVGSFDTARECEAVWGV